MTGNPTPEEATRALRDVDERKGQAMDSRTRSPWVDVVFGAGVFAMLAAQDFVGKDAGAVAVMVVALLAVIYNFAGRSRRGAAALGQPTRVRREAISLRFGVPAVTILAVAMLLGILLPVLDLHPLAGVPYWRTGLGAILGLALILFGRKMQSGANALARGRDESGVRHEQR